MSVLYHSRLSANSQQAAAPDTAAAAAAAPAGKKAKAAKAGKAKKARRAVEFLA